MQTVLWDIIKADAFTAEIIMKNPAKNGTAENLKLQQEIFTIHKITKDNFYKSYEYYKENPGKLKVIMDSMIIQAERNKAKNFTIKAIQAN